MPAPLLLFLSVLLLYLASPAPGFSFLAWIALAPLLLFCRRTSPLKTTLWALAGGVLYHLFLVYWVTISMETYGGLQPLVSWPALFLLALYMALYFALFCFLISKTKKSLPMLWFAPVLWVSLDYIRGIFLTGFPWMDLGYSQFSYPTLIQTADLFGHHGVTFVLVLINALLAQILVDKKWFTKHIKQACAALLLVTITLAYSIIRIDQIRKDMKTSPAMEVAVIQANIDQALKWKKAHKKISVDRHLQLTQQARKNNQATLVIWPETALAFYPSHDPLMAYVEKETIKKDSYHLLTGAPYVLQRNKGYDYYNSALLLSPQDKVDIYFKQHLVPFGEYIPMRSILPIPKPIVESMGDFSAGTSGRPLEAGPAKIGALICVEAIFPDLARKEAGLGANLFANITNDAWFGKSSAPVQLLAMSIFRSVENRRSMARAANTGISALIMPTGEVAEQTSLFEPAYLSGQLPLLTNITFFTKLGFLFPLFCLGVSLTLLALNFKKERSQVK